MDDRMCGVWEKYAWILREKGKLPRDHLLFGIHFLKFAAVYRFSKNYGELSGIE